jgi:hypothetical protein
MHARFKLISAAQLCSTDAIPGSAGDFLLPVSLEIWRPQYRSAVQSSSLMYPLHIHPLLQMSPFLLLFDFCKELVAQVFKICCNMASRFHILACHVCNFWLLYNVCLCVCMCVCVCSRARMPACYLHISIKPTEKKTLTYPHFTYRRQNCSQNKVISLLNCLLFSSCPM